MYIDLPIMLLQDRNLRSIDIKTYCCLSHRALLGMDEFDESIINELSETLKEAHPKVWRAVQNLCRYGYLAQTSSYNRYRLIKERDIDQAQHAVARQFDATEFTLPWPELRTAWQRWVRYYENKFDRIDIVQAEALVGHIDRMLKQQADIDEAINYSIAGGYRQIYAQNRYQNASGANAARSAVRKETPFERQKRIISEKRARRQSNKFEEP